MMLRFGGIEFEDYRFANRDEWVSQWKPQAIYGQCPLLEVDGKMLAQSNAIERYAASLTSGLIPTDLWEQAKMNEAIAFQQEILDVLYPTYYITDADERIKARKALAEEGSLKTKLDLLSTIIDSRTTTFLVSEFPTYADFSVFKNLSHLASGTIDGIEATYLDRWPKLKAFHDVVAIIPQVKAMYSKAEGTMKAYQPFN
jgi:glutathione S-transferase